jgi:hypothetical protein
VRLAASQIIEPPRPRCSGLWPPTTSRTTSSGIRRSPPSLKYRVWSLAAPDVWRPGLYPLPTIARTSWELGTWLGVLKV